MNKYRVQHLIETLAENAVDATAQLPSFTVDKVKLYQMGFNHSEGWRTHYWIAEEHLEDENYKKAYIKFRKKLQKVVPRIALVSQCYTRSALQPFLITRPDKDEGYFYHIFDQGSTGLMFMEDEEKALSLLLKNKTIPEEFFYYWEDAVNSTGYAAKLLLMFSALEAISKSNKFPQIEKILGKELKDICFEPTKGVRHRLVHGEYFAPNDFKRNLVEDIHRKVIEYFNDEIFKDKLITETVVGPQRHLYENKLEGKFFIKPKQKDRRLEIEKVVKDFNGNEWNQQKVREIYDFIYDVKLADDF